MTECTSHRKRVYFFLWLCEVCLSISAVLCLFTCLCLSVCLSVSLSLCLHVSVCPTVSLCMHLLICLSVSFCLYVCLLSVCLYLSVCLSVSLCLHVYLSVFVDREWVFDFGVKFYVPEPNVLQEEITRFVLSCCLHPTQ